MNPPDLRHGELLFRLLPGLYRNRDGGDLARYLDACGELLDLIFQTLEQLRLDSFPDLSPDGQNSQDWVLPYIAPLLGIRLESEQAAGRREEIGRAVPWHQGKGARAVLGEIAAAIGGIEVQIQEGWQRVAVTPTINDPLAFFDGAARPAATTVDVGRSSLAVSSTPAQSDDPSVRHGAFSGVEVAWRIADPQGVPAFPGTYQDASRRTVDTRTPQRDRGRIHPRRLLFYYPAEPALEERARCALLDKLKGFLPAGVEVVLIADPTLPNPPPEAGDATER